MARTRADSALRRRFSAWAMGIWMLLLFAALGSLQYLQHGEYAYLIAAFVVIVICGACLLRQSWARTAMQAMAVVLAVWALISGALMVGQWGDFEIARQHALAQPALAEVALWMIARARRTWQVAIVLKAAAVPLLLWLAWRMGRLDVRSQFSARRR